MHELIQSSQSQLEARNRILGTSRLFDESIEQLEDLKSVLADNESSSAIDLFKSLSWFHKVDVNLKFLEKWGNKHAIFQDQKSSNKYSLRRDIFDRCNSSNRILKWEDFSEGAIYKCSIYSKHYFLMYDEFKNKGFSSKIQQTYKSEVSDFNNFSLTNITQTKIQQSSKT